MGNSMNHAQIIFTRCLKADAYARRRAHEAVATYLAAAGLAFVMAGLMAWGWAV